MKNNNKGLYIIVAILLILVMALGGYIVYDKVNNKQDNSTTNDNDKTISVNDDVNVKITLGDYSINMSSPNNKLELKGTIDVSYDSNKYYGLALYGYCLFSAFPPFPPVGKFLLEIHTFQAQIVS